MSNKNKKEIIPLTNFNEILQDAFYFTLLLNITEKMMSREAKHYIFIFLKGFSTLFSRELLILFEKYNEIFPTDINRYREANKKIREERQWVNHTIRNSSTIRNRILNMGIDFNKEIYDITIFIKDGELLDIIFEENIESEDIKLWKELYSFPRFILYKKMGNHKTLDMVFKELSDKTNKNISELEEKISGKEYYYSVNKLFKDSKSLKDEDKIFILYRYRFIKSVLLMNKLFDKISVCFLSDEFSIDLNAKDYLRKVKAILISILGKDLLEMETEYSNIILSELSNKILEPNFYKINRKARGNIHYAKIINLSSREKEILDKYQDQYLNIIVKSFDKNIKIVIDDETVTLTGFLEDCKVKGISIEQLRKDYFKYEKLYMDYYNKTHKIGLK